MDEPSELQPVGVIEGVEQLLGSEHGGLELARQVARRRGRQVHDRLGAGELSGPRTALAQVAPHQGDAVVVPRCAGEPGSGTHQGDHLVAGAPGSAHDRGTEEATGAGDEHLHDAPPSATIASTSAAVSRI
ncbi:MAG: hypothetical protein R2713_06925 [Ilumatobacteraceae bacterium]